MRKNFKDYILRESVREKTIVFSFGRFQPPTIGHQLLVNKVIELAKQHKAEHRIYASKTQDKKSNPLDVETKVHFLKKMFPSVNFEAANETVRTFIEALKQLYKEGYQKVYMVAGSDRLMEYQKLFDRYNGVADFDFKILQAVSAGERDPDAEGAAGMSGTKMREAAIQGNFSLFRSGVPKTLSDQNAKELMEKIRKSMNIKEFNEFVAEDTQELNEGINDKSLFKIIFLAGGPGSGKDFIMKKLLSGLGLVEINSDVAFTYMLNKFNFSQKMGNTEPTEKQQRDLLRDKAKNTAQFRQKFAMLARNGLIINGTGANPEGTKDLIDMFRQLGYDTPHMLVVNTQDAVSQERNIVRGERGGRALNEPDRKQKWDMVQAAIPVYKKMFGANYHEVNNSKNLDKNSPPDLKAQKDREFDYLSNVFRKYVEAPVNNEIANDWKESQRSAARRASGESPQSDSRGSSNSIAKVSSDVGRQLVSRSVQKQANSMKLTYMGYGRFGKNGKVTHKIDQDELVAISPQARKRVVPLPLPESKNHKSPTEIARDHEVPLVYIMKQLQKGIQEEYEHTNSEKLARIIALQHLDEIPSYYTRLKKAELHNESLSELFDGGKEYKWTHRDANQVEADFIVGKVNYSFLAVQDPGSIGEWYIQFRSMSKSGFGITGSGNSVQVFGTVVEIIKSFMETYKSSIKKLTFAAKEDSRQVLYGRMIKKLLPNWKMERTTLYGDEAFTLTRPDLSKNLIQTVVKENVGGNNSMAKRKDFSNFLFERSNGARKID